MLLDGILIAKEIAFFPSRRYAYKKKKKKEIQFLRVESFWSLTRIPSSLKEKLWIPWKTLGLVKYHFVVK